MHQGILSLDGWGEFFLGLSRTEVGDASLNSCFKDSTSSLHKILCNCLINSGGSVAESVINRKVKNFGLHMMTTSFDLREEIVYDNNRP